MDYMNPLNKLRWREAIKARAPYVTLLDGRTFRLTYHSDNGRHGHNRKGQVFFEPAPTGTTVSLVPRGTLDIETVLDDVWMN